MHGQQNINISFSSRYQKYNIHNTRDTFLLPVKKK